MIARLDTEQRLALGARFSGLGDGRRTRRPGAALEVRHDADGLSARDVKLARAIDALG